MAGSAAGPPAASSGCVRFLQISYTPQRPHSFPSPLLQGASTLGSRRVGTMIPEGLASPPQATWDGTSRGRGCGTRSSGPSVHPRPMGLSSGKASSQRSALAWGPAAWRRVRSCPAAAMQKGWGSPLRGDSCGPGLFPETPGEGVAGDDLQAGDERAGAPPALVRELGPPGSLVGPPSH